MSEALPIGIWLPIKGGASLVDRDTFALVGHLRWKLDSWGYVCRNVHKPDGKSTTVFLHRVIAQPPRALQIDHRNGDKLDNRSGNLRPATQSQNQASRGPRAGGSSRFKGVSKIKGGRWVAVCREQRLGSFEREEDAARAYDAAALRVHGEFAFQNFPQEKAA